MNYTLGINLSQLKFAEKSEIKRNLK